MVVSVLIIMYGSLYLIIKMLKEEFSGVSLRRGGKTIYDATIENLEKQGIRFYGTYEEEAKVRRSMPPIANINERNAELDRRCRKAGFLSTNERCKYYQIFYPKKKK